jgi:hypothetical protein
VDDGKLHVAVDGKAPRHAGRGAGFQPGGLGAAYAAPLSSER